MDELELELERENDDILQELLTNLDNITDNDDAHRVETEMSHAKKTQILVFAESEWSFGDQEHAVLLHKSDNKTYLRGRCQALGLDPPDDGVLERECDELRGQKIVQAVFSANERAAYVVTDGGMLYSCGVASRGQLGRLVTTVANTKFGQVEIDGPVLAVVACGGQVMAMTSNKVFFFGARIFKQPGMSLVEEATEPREMYSGEGPTSPRQVACGVNHSAILTAGGQVLTSGRAGYTGHGHKENVMKMTPVLGLADVDIQQIGCTGYATYALGDGVLYGWGDNDDENVSTDIKDDLILEPVIVDCGGCRITSLRCSRCMVFSLTDTGETFTWGRCDDDIIITRPQPPRSHRLTQMVYTKRKYSDSGGTLCIATNEYGSTAETEAALNGAEVKIRELLYPAEGANKRETDVRELEHQITALTRELDISKTRENTLEKVVQGFCNQQAHVPLHPQQGTTEMASRTQTGNHHSLGKYSRRQISVVQKRALRKRSAGQLQEHHNLAVERRDQFAITEQQTVMESSTEDETIIVDPYLQTDPLTGQVVMVSPFVQPTGALNPAENHAIKKNYLDLVSDMPAEQVLDFFIRERIINDQQRAKISSMATEEEKGRMILESTRRHPKGYATLTMALASEYCGSGWLADRLRKDVEEFHKMAVD